MKRNPKHGGRDKLCGVLLLALSCTATAQDEDPAADETIDEITVYGESSLVRLEMQVDVAQEAMFEAFNKVNTNPAFAVRCTYQKRLGTRRRYLECVPRFATLPPARVMASPYTFVRNGRDDPTPQNPYMRKMNAQFWTEVSRHVSENPELQREFVRLAEAKGSLDTERDKRRNKQ